MRKPFGGSGLSIWVGPIPLMWAYFEVPLPKASDVASKILCVGKIKFCSFGIIKRSLHRNTDSR